MRRGPLSLGRSGTHRFLCIFYVRYWYEDFKIFCGLSGQSSLLEHEAMMLYVKKHFVREKEDLMGEV